MGRTTDGPSSPSGPSNAEQAHAIVFSARVGALSTLALDPAGYPFGSLVAYALDDRGCPVLCLSDLAEHSQNLAQDARASLMVAEALAAAADPLALGRVSLLGTVARASVDDATELRARFLAAHPDAAYVDFGDFGLYRLDVQAVRYVGGFGRMSWVDAEAYRAAAAVDSLRPSAP